MTIWIEEIEVQVEKKPIKNIYLRVKPPSGQVVVSAPRAVSHAAIEGFIRSRLPWIRKKRAQLAARLELLEGMDGQVLVWGEPVRIQIKERPGRAEVEWIDGVLTLWARPGSTEEKRRRILWEWYRQTLREETARLLPVWEERMGLFASEWQIKAMKTRWGTCNTRTKKIWLNLHLAENPKECLEYVIVHELAHLKVPNHSKEFWDLVEQFLPGWKERRERLNWMGVKDGKRRHGGYGINK